MDGKRAVAIAVSVALAVSGCATASKDIATSYVSPNQYANYDCQQLAAEAGRIQMRVVQLGGRLDQAAQNDAGIMAVGLILFWPVLFALGGTKQQEAEYARLKGEYDAVEQAAIQKKCAHTVPGGQATTATADPAAVTSPLPAQSPIQPAVLTTTSAAQPQQAQPQQVAAAPVKTTAATSSVAGVSKYMYTAERFAKDNGCTGAVASLNIKSQTYETFTVACTSGDPRLVRCDDGAACRELK
jgi:uncharacterized protein YceK